MAHSQRDQDNRLRGTGVTDGIPLLMAKVREKRIRDDMIGSVEIVNALDPPMIRCMASRGILGRISCGETGGERAGS